MEGRRSLSRGASGTSTHAIGLGMRTIQYGDADVIIAGGGEMATTRIGFGSFGQAKALSTRNDAPQEASRPWDKDRDGFVLSDGGGAVLLEALLAGRTRPRLAGRTRPGVSATMDA